MDSRTRAKLILFLQALVISVGVFCGGFGGAQINKDIDEYRFRVALKLFPRIAATDQNLGEKLTENGRIRLLIYFENNRQLARRLTELLKENLPRIGKREIDYHFSNDLDAFSNSHTLPTAVFLSEPLNSNELKELVNYSQKYQRLVFSPFEGDVERGIAAGIHISNKITPYFNMRALARSHIDLNQGLLRVSTRYE